MTSLFSPPPSSYQDVPYSNDPYRSSHPDHLATVAILSGLTPAAVPGCRVLELGCARGGNLIPMATGMPGASFVGIDSSPRQVREACELIESLGLRNIRVELRDILALDPTIGTFDYIICHGMFSWVERDVQEKILEISAANLAPNGIVYISYNTYPGWHFRGLVREMMCYHARRFEQPADRAREARGLLQFMTRSTVGIEPVYSNILKQELDYLTERSDSYLLHDHLEMVNDPIYFHDFVERARSRGLQYVSEVQGTWIAPESLPPGIAIGLRAFSANDVEFEQYMDFVINRRFRQSVLCPAGVELRRPASPYGLDRLYVAARSTGDHAAAASQDDPLVKAALDHLHQIWPLSLPFEALLVAARTRMEASTDPQALRMTSGAEELKSGLIRCYGQKRVELNTVPPLFVLTKSDKPVASPVARMQAQVGNTVTNLRHEAGQLNAFGREVLAALDGTHDRAAIVAKLIQSVEQGRITLTPKDPDVSRGTAGHVKTLQESLADSLDECLSKLARFALLVS